MGYSFGSFEEAYRSMFTDEPDIVNVEKACAMLCVERRQIYKLIRNSELETLAHGKGYLITKKSIVAYVLRSNADISA